MAEVVLDGVTKRYPDGTIAVDDLSVHVRDREFLVLVGPSGCGKSTTLRLIAGLESVTSGGIRIGDRLVNDVSPKDRDIAMVFQNYALYPHMTVYRNLAFGLQLRYGGGLVARVVRRFINPRRAAELSDLRRGIDGRVRQAAERLGIGEMMHRKPHELSGGERQRVALGRAIVRNPAAFLFDEPLSNLDANLRQQMRAELKQLHAALSATTIYVTHDQIEAMTLGQRVAVMHRGKLQQAASPIEIYERPANLFVAKFFGSTPINLIEGRLNRSAERTELVSGDWRIRVSDFDARHGWEKWPERVTLGCRGEDVYFAGDQAKRLAALPESEVVQVDHWGDATVATFSWKKELPMIAKLTRGCEVRVGDRISLGLDVKRCLWFDTTTGNILK